MREVILNDEELAIINRIQNYQFPEAGYDPYEVNYIYIISNITYKTH